MISTKKVFYKMVQMVDAVKTRMTSAESDISAVQGKLLALIDFNNAEKIVDPPSGYSATASLEGGAYLGQEIDLGEIVAGKYPVFNGFDILGTGTARIHTLGHYIYHAGDNHWYAYVKMRNDGTTAINNFTTTAYIIWITI